MKHRCMVAAYLVILSLVAAVALVGCEPGGGPSNNNNGNNGGTGGTAGYSGVVQNGVGADPIAGATVYLELTDSMTGDGYVYVPPSMRAAAGARQAGLASTTSGPDGSFSFDGLQPGSYQITVEPPATRAGMIRLAGAKVDLEAGENTEARLPLITSADLDGAEVRVTPERATLEAGGEQVFTVILRRRDGSEIQAFYPVWSLSRPIGSLSFPPDGSCRYRAPSSAEPTTLTVNASVGDPSESSAFLSGSAVVDIAGGSGAPTSTTGSVATGGATSGSMPTPGQAHSYQWSAQPGTYDIRVDVFDGFDSVLEISEGSRLLDWNDDGGFGLGSRITFTAPYATTYTLTVSGYGDTSTGRYELSVTSLSGSAGGNTIETGASVNGTIGAAGDSASYLWTADPGIYSVEVATQDGFDSIVELWRDGVLLDSNDDGGVGLGSLLSVTVTSRTQYEILVRGYGGYSTGPFTLTITQTQSSGEGQVVATASDVLQVGEEHTYDWTTSPGTYVIETVVSDGLDTILDVYRSGTLIASNDDGGVGYASRIELVITSNETLQVVVRGFGGISSGSYTVNVIQLLTGSSGDAVVTWSGAVDGTWPVVFNWDATPGTYIIETHTDGVDTVMEVVLDGTSIALDDDSGVNRASRIDLIVWDAASYEIWVYGYNELESGPFELTVTRMGDAGAAARSIVVKDKSTAKYVGY